MILQTTKGPIDDSLLRHERIEEPAPCGKSIEDRWFLNDELVKSDVRVEVKSAPTIGAKGGLIPC